MAMHLIHTIGSIIAAFAEEYLNRHHNMGKPRKRLDGESAK